MRELHEDTVEVTECYTACGPPRFLTQGLGCKRICQIGLEGKRDTLFVTYCMYVVYVMYCE